MPKRITMGCNTSQEQNAAPTDENNQEANQKSATTTTENGKTVDNKDKLTNGHTVDDAMISEGNFIGSFTHFKIMHKHINGNF